MPKIYTKTGDSGETSMLGGKRVSKSCLEMEAIGEIDELNSWLGILVEEIGEKFKKEARKLGGVQKNLFVIGIELATLQMERKVIKKLSNLEIKKLERWIDMMEKDLPKLKNFIFYSGSEEAVKAFYARAICRRAERKVIGLEKKYILVALPLSGGADTKCGGGLVLLPNIKQYLNRLSDLLFVLGRWFNMQEGVGEITWEK